MNIALLQLFLSSLLFGQIDMTIQEKGLKALIQDHNNVGVSAGYAINGETVWLGSEGYANLEKEIATKENTITRIASLAKPMTAIAIMQLVEKGKLTLDDHVDKHISDFPQKGKKPITVRQLLSHTSGIKGYKNGKEARTNKEYPTLQDALDLFKNRKLKFDPGTDFLYSSYGYVVLGAIIEIASGQTYQEYMQEHIWDIAGMSHTGIEAFNAQYINKSVLYHKEKGKVKREDQNNLSNRIPGGGFHSTVTDIIKFGNAVLVNQLITQESLETITTISHPCDSCNPYGLGWFLYGPKGNEQKLIGHGGGQIGVNAQLLICPILQCVVVVLSNTSETGNGIIKYAVSLYEEIAKDYNVQKSVQEETSSGTLE